MNQEIKPADEQLPFHADDTGSDANTPAVTAGLLPLAQSQSLTGKPARKLAGRKLVTTLNLTSRTCKWPVGDPAKPGFHYCGALPLTGRPYCDAHDRMSYQPAPRRKSS